jgi:acetamidase/formamidase
VHAGAEIGARVHLRFKLEKGGATEWPWMETHDRWITTASAPTFEDAAEFCTRSMIKLLGDRLGVSPADAFGLMSIAADLRINQYCKMPKLGTSIRCEFPKLGAGITRAAS